MRRVSGSAGLWPLLATVVVGGLLALAGFGRWRWQRATAALRAELRASRIETAPAVVRLDSLLPLPAPVQRYLRLVLRDGLALPHGLLLRQEGTFNMKSDGFVDTVTAASCARLVGGVSRPAPWQGRFWNYALRHGQRVPLQGEVAWLLPGGAMPCWRGRVTALSPLPS
jgi:hypothetical protein